MSRVLQWIVSFVLLASLGGCIFYDRPHHDHWRRPPPYYGPQRGY